ncbi:MAG: ATP-binding protein [Desulfobacterales bacterium]|nr:ATP-binding protein [Desulfobacterales bacterium]
MKKLPKLPLGVSSFEYIRENNHIYVDKTRYIYQLIDEGMFYFMSRPRRFGKSLTVSVLRCLFQGRKELFEGLWIKDRSDWEWKTHPVILLDFNGISHDTPENMKMSLQRTLKRAAEAYDLVSDAPLLKDQFKELILSLCRKTGMQVVILIDEYDKPLIDHLGKGEKALEIAKANRDILKYFLGVLKDGDVSSALRFVFITGVSKFSRVSIFSELNNLEDISMSEPYADMIGYTQDELEECFRLYIKRLSEATGCSEAHVTAKLAQYYNGYRFSKRNIHVYNPFSVLCALKQKDFKNYWFETGTPTFLVNILNEKKWYLPEIENMKAGEAVFSTYELDNLKPEALLFQTGYLTIHDVKQRLYFFGYPNQEVKTSFLETLFHSYTEGLRESSLFLLLAEYLHQEDFTAFFETVSAIFASIPYMLEIKRDEAYFHTVFYLMLCASGIDARSEVLTCDGRIDLVVEFPDKIFITEFKCNQSAEAGISQIREKGYDQKYKQSGKKLILMGINFDTEKRNVADWKTE